MEAQAFWSRVDLTAGTDGCWRWLGGHHAGGYGAVWVERRQWPVHRYAYERLVGPIPDGLVLDHLCRVRDCVNPRHLEPVTDRENVLRGVGLTAANARKTACVNGHELSVTNTYITTKGSRTCRTCRTDQQVARNGPTPCPDCGSLMNIRAIGLHAKRKHRQEAIA